MTIEIADVGTRFVFTDGHGIAAFTQWHDDLAQMDQLDWPLILNREWADTLEDNDRKRRKQAKFLIHQSLPWSMVRGIAVINDKMADRARNTLNQFPDTYSPPVRVVPQWYYQS